LRLRFNGSSWQLLNCTLLLLIELQPLSVEFNLLVTNTDFGSESVEFLLLLQLELSKEVTGDLPSSTQELFKE
jgi:hypothetical protein